MRLKASTLIEMLVVMVLSVIVVGIAYLVYDQVNLLNQELQQRTVDAQELLTLDQHLRADAQRATNIQTAQDEFTFLQPHGVIAAQYQRNPAGISRSANNQSEMFNVQIQRIQLDSNPQAKTLVLLIGPDIEAPDTLQIQVTRPATARAYQNKPK